MSNLVVHVAQIFSPGGAGRAILSVAKRNIARHGNRHLIVSLDAPSQTAKDLARTLGIEVLTPSSERELHGVLERADVVLLHWWNSPRMARLLRSRLPEMRLAIWFHVGGDRAPQFIDEEIVRFADFAAACSPRTALSSGFQALTTQEREGKAAMIFAAAEIEPFLNLQRVSHDGFRIGYVGTVDPVKMHADFVDLCHSVRLPDARFVVCGSLGASDLVAQAARLGDDRFEFLGQVQDVASQLARMDVFGYPLCPETYAGSELALQEAMAAGIPAVVFPYGGLSELVRHGENGLVVKTAVEYRDAIESLANDRALRERLSRGARKWAEEECSPDRWAQRWQDVFESLMSRPKRNRDPLGDLRKTRSWAEWFASSIGPEGSPFATSLASNDPDALLAAEASIGSSSHLLRSLHSGGILGWCAAFPEDPHFHLWAGLVKEQLGQPAEAVAEFSQAWQGGIGHWRVLWYMARILARCGMPRESADLCRKISTMTHFAPADRLLQEIAPPSFAPLPRISMVVPSFNQARFLESTLRSILDQDYPNLQLVVMDGGSTDGSVEIIRKYADRIHHWQSAKDGGQYRAIEDGFRRCDGDIMGWLNSDDMIHPFSLWKVARIFLENPQTEWIMGRPTSWDREGNLVEILDIPSWSRRRVVSGDFRWIQQESSFWKSSLWRKAGSSFHPELRLAGDFELWVRFFRHATLQVIDGILGGFRHHGDQKSAQQIQEYLAECETVLSRERLREDLDFSPAAPPSLKIEDLDKSRLLGKGYTSFLPRGILDTMPAWLEARGLRTERGILEDCARRTFPAASVLWSATTKADPNPPSDDSPRNLAELDDALTKGDLRTAVELAERIVSSHPQNADHLRTSGHIHLKLGNLEMARNRFHRATAVAPDSASAHADLGVVWYLLERWPDAKRHLEIALKLDPSRHDLHELLHTIAQKSNRPAWPDCDLDARRLRIPPTGSTERFIRMDPVRRSSMIVPGSTLVRNLSIRGFGSGDEAFSGIVRHILENKIGMPGPTPAISARGCIAFGLEIDLARARDGAPITASSKDLVEFDPEFARLEGTDRSKDILAYKERILSGEAPPAATFVTGAFLDSCGANVAADELWMIDGARRISAQALAGRGTIRAVVITTEAHHATLLPADRILRLKERIARIEWFANYQSIPLVGLQGDRSTRRFELIDPRLLEGATVADWGCNIGQASVKAALLGATNVLGIEGMPDTFAAAEEVGKLSGLSNLRFARIDFNAPDFDRLVDAVLPDQVDWSFFFSVYRTKELVQRDRLFQKIIDKSRKGIFFEGHADAVIDTIEYHKWLFEAYGLEWRHLGNSEGDLRPLFLLTWKPDTQRRQNPSWTASTSATPGTGPTLAAPKPEAGAGPLVTAIVSTYASSSLLRHRMENLLSQTLGDRLEIIVVDSGSPENDGEVAEEFALRDPRVRVIRTAERETIYQAWNRGVEAARGKFLTNANTDDVLRRDALERLAMELETDPGIDLAYGDFWITHLPNQDFDGAVRTGYSLKPDWRPDIMMSGCHMGPQPMWRRSLHERFGLFDASLFAAGDYEFWCRCAAGGAKFRHIPEFLGLYLHNLKGICNGDVPRVARETAAIKERYRSLLPPTPPDFKAEGFYRKEPLPVGSGFVNIGMVTWNRLEFTKQALESLWKRTRYPYKITVVDNGSTDGSVEWLTEMHRQGIISNLLLLGQNVGVAKASNLAWAQEPNSSHYIKFDNDIILQKDAWLEEIVHAADTLPEVGLIAYSFEPRTFPVVEARGVRVRPKPGTLGGACILVPRRTQESLGVWSEDYGLYGEEDQDYGFRIMIAGLVNAYMEDEDVGFHLPAGKAAVIDTETFVAKDGQEEVLHADYRRTKDESRARNHRSGIVQANLDAYRSGAKPLKVESAFVSEYNSGAFHRRRPVLSVLVCSLNPQENCCGYLRATQHLLRNPAVRLCWIGGGASASDLAEALRACDIVMVQRGFVGLDSAMKAIRSSGKPWVLEMDDLLWKDLPSTNPHAQEFRASAPALRDALQKCDAAIASSLVLGAEMELLAKDVALVPNLLDPRLWAGFPPPPTDGPVVIGYAGTATHSADLAFLDGVLEQIAAIHGDKVAFRFFGCATPTLSRLPGARFEPFNDDYPTYSKTLGFSGIHIALAPLADHPFNRAKSAIKWLEYSACHCAGVYTDIPPYSEIVRDGENGFLAPNDPQAWFERIDRLIRDPALRSRVAASAHHEATSNFMLDPSESPLVRFLSDVHADHVRSRASDGIRVSIVIPVHGHLDLTRQCVEHVQATTDPRTTEIVVVDDASPDATAEWMRERMSKGAIQGVFLSPNRGFAGACNAGAEVCRGQFIVFLNNDTIVRSGWLEALTAPLVDDPGIGLTGARLLYPEGDIQHAGIRLHPNGLPDHEFRHAAADDPRVIASRDRAFVTGACIALRKDLFSKIGCFDTGFRMYVEDLDLCLKVWSEGLRVRYVAECVVVHLESRTTPDLEKRTALVKTGMERLFSRWMGRWPEGLFRLEDWPANFRNAQAPPAPPVVSDAPRLHAFAPTFNFTGYARLDREAFLAAETTGVVQLSLDPSVNSADFIKDLESQGEAATAPWNRILSRKPEHDGFCLVSDLPCNFAKLRAARPAFARYAGLTMFETDRLPSGWKDDCLGVDEIWVPSTFNLRSFAAAGVPERMLKRIPCGIDMDRYRPGACAPLNVQGRRGTNFLSVFEWTPRKGWDALLLGWAKAFRHDDDASLTLKTYIAASQPGELAARIDSFYRSQNIDPTSLAPIIVVDGFLPEAAMPGLYAAADVFALPTRGEGWGLPYLEAMASGIPVIATGWSAHLDFVTSDNGYLVEHRLVPVSKEQTGLSAYYGADHLWADPSVEHFTELLRRCHRQRDEVRSKGAKARLDVQEAWSSRRTAQWIADRIRGIESKTTIPAPSSTKSLSVTSLNPRIGFDARTLSVADSIVRGIGNYAWHHLLAILETRSGCDLTILHDDSTAPPTEIVKRTTALGAKWAAWSSRTAADFDLFHTPDPMHVYPGYASPFQRFGSTRVTATFHDIIPIRVYEGRIANWPGYLARLDEIIECKATMLCNSEFTRKDLLSASSLEPRRAVAVMAGFNGSTSGRTWSKPQGDALLRRLGIDKPFFLHVGAADPHKNFESSLAACQVLGKSRSVQFVVAGKLANSLAAMREQVVQAGLLDVVFTDYLEREELELLYSRAVATLFLSRYEGFGFPALEAMASGCPVIASNAASIPEIVGDAGLMHAPDDLQGIASSMVKLLDTPSLRDDLIARGKERARRFDWKEVARRTWQEWDRLLTESSPQPSLPPPPARTQWISPVWDASGYGDESRAFLKHLASTDLGVGVLAWGRHSESFRKSANAQERKLLDSLMGRELVAGRPVVLDIPAGSLGRVSDGGIHVGRTTFETNGLPAEWVTRCNAMDELWVPCRFNQDTFSKAGVTKPILVVPEGVDVDKFRPGLDPLPLPGTRKGTTYLSIFEWTHRKGPDLLLEAWAKSFSASDDVELLLRCYPPNQIEGDPSDWIDRKIDEELARIGTWRSRCAPIVVLAKQVPDADMPRLYAAANIYLAPSRGEGWGRPHMEAMSCGLAVIATRWSGNLEFQNDDNSWLIDIDGLEEIDAREEFPFYRGQKWASPSISHLIQLLRTSATDAVGRRRLGEAARRDMVETWDWKKIAPMAELRLREILGGVPAHQSALKAPRSQGGTPRVPNTSPISNPIRWCGQMFNFSGYARLSRETLAGLMDADVPVTADPLLPDKNWFSGISADERARWSGLLQREPVPGVLVCCDIPFDAEGRNELFQQMQEANPGCVKRVGWTMFETDRLPKGWAEALNKLDEVWVPSEFNRLTFAKAGVDAAKLHVVPGGIDPSRYANATALSIQGPRRATTFLSVFQWTRRKGWDVLLRAWAQAFKPQADVRLVLRCHPFGNDTRSMRDVFDQSLRSLGLTESEMAPIVLMDGFVPESTLPSLYAACDVFVLPSRGEGWGFPFLEAMATGKPCIATAWGASMDFLDTECAWLASPGDLVEVNPDDLCENRYLAPGHRWANPDPAEIAGFLRQAASDVPLRLRKSQAALRTASRWNHHRTARAIVGRITALAPHQQPSPSNLTDALRATANGIIQRRNPSSPGTPQRPMPAGGSHPTEAIRLTAEGIRSRRGVAPAPAASPGVAPMPPPTGSLSIRWEGSQFVHHSLANVNREICLRLAKAGHDLSLIPFEPDQFAPGADPDLGILASLHNAPLEGPCQVHVRHQWPPRLDAPPQGHWVVVQPWEFGSPPKDWIPAFKDRVDEIWCYSQYVKRVYLEAGIPEAKLAVVPLGVDVDKYRPGLAPLPDLARDPSRTTFLFVGGTIARKGFDCLLNAWAKAFGPKDPVRLVVKGMGGGTFYKGQTGEAMVRDLNASGKAAPVVLFERDLAPHEVPHIYACADILVHPYRGEGFGLPIAEAMASGLPCIVTKGGSADDFCGAEEAWLVESVRTPVPGGKVGPFETVAAPWWLEPDLDSLVFALRAAYAKPEARQTKGRAARARIESGFTWDHAAAKMESRLGLLASRPATTRSVASTKFVSALDKLSIRISTPGGLDPVPLSIPGSRVDSDEAALLDRLLIRAEAAAARKDFAEAEDLTRQAVEQHPRQNMAWLARAMILRGLGKFRKATEAIEQSLRLEDTPDALLESVLIHLAANELGAARKAEKALKDRHGAWLKAARELFRAKGQTWPLDLLKPAKAATPARKGKR